MAETMSELKFKVTAVTLALLTLIASYMWLIKHKAEPVDVGLIEAKNYEKCPYGFFKLRSMQLCKRQLDCDQIINELVVGEIFGSGAVKLVQHGSWFGYRVAVNCLANPTYREDFQHGLVMLRHLHFSSRVVQLVGSCEEKDIFVTEFHKLGSADKLNDVLSLAEYKSLDTLSVRFGLCQQYVAILHFLHSEVDADGARVLCDTNDVKKTLSQFLLDDDLNLILNDVDALPLANRSQGQLVKCGHRQLSGDFVAPEQLWPFEDEDFEDGLMPGYDEKVDIWKVPDICDSVLGHAKDSIKLRLELLPIHLQCKSEIPSERPTALHLLQFYHNARVKLKL